MAAAETPRPGGTRHQQSTTAPRQARWAGAPGHPLQHAEVSVPGLTAGLPAPLQHEKELQGRAVAVVQVVIRPASCLLRLQKLGDVQFLTLLGLCAAPQRRGGCARAQQISARRARLAAANMCACHHGGGS